MSKDLKAGLSHTVKWRRSRGTRESKTKARKRGQSWHVLRKSKEVKKPRAE